MFKNGRFPFISYFKYLSFVLFAFSIISGGISLFLLLIEPRDYIFPTHPLATFKDAFLKNQAGIIISPDKVYKVYASKNILLDTSSLLPPTSIRRYVTSYRIEIAGKKLWCSKNLTASFQKNPETNEEQWFIKLFFEKNYYFLPYSFLFLSLSLFFAYLYNCEKKQQYFYLIYIFLWLGLGSLFFYLNGFFIIYNKDPEQFFNIAKEWLDFNRHTTIPNSVGAAIFYLPFIILLRPESYWDMAIPFSTINLTIVGASSIAFIILLAKQLSVSGRVHHCVAILSCLFPFVTGIYYPCYGTVSECKSLLHLGSLAPYSQELRFQAVLCGWNGLSDNLALLFILMGIAVLWKTEISVRRYFFPGIFLGFALTLRYGSIVILPAVFFWDIATLIKNKTPLKKILGYYSVFAITGILAFSPQLIDNLIIKGSPFLQTADRHLYNGEESLWNMFRPENLPDGLNFYFQIHYKFLLLFSFILFLIKDRKIAVTLWLWTIVPLVFFSSTNFYKAEGVRYLISIFPAIFLAVSLFCGSINRKELILISVLLILNMALTAPESPGPFAYIIIPGILHFIIPLISSAILVCAPFLLGASTKNSIMMAFFFLFFALGQWWTALAILAVFPLYLLFEPVIVRSFSAFSSTRV